MVTFEKLKIGDYFRIPGISADCVYRKASSSHCSLNALLQPIKSETQVIQLNVGECKAYFAAKQNYLKSLLT